MSRHPMSYPTIHSSLVYFLCLLLLRRASGTTITVLNKCEYTVWPAIAPTAGGSSGFELYPGGSRSLQAPPGWSGRVWARTGCAFNPYTGQGSCLTGNCGSSQLDCNGSGPTQPATLAEFTLASGSNSPDYYDVSLVDGYNVHTVIQARGGDGSCGTAGCAADINQHCPTELRVGDGQACRSACMAFGTPEYCCSGPYASPATCKPSLYSQMFKSVCPRAYSYAYDDQSSTFTCAGADYEIVFCPGLLTSQQKSSSDPQFSSTDPQIIPGYDGFGFPSGTQPIINPPFGPGSTIDPGSGSGSGSGSTIGPGSGSCSSSDTSTKHTPVFFIGGGQMLPNASPPTSTVTPSSFAWRLITSIIASVTLQLLRLSLL